MAMVEVVAEVVAEVVVVVSALVGLESPSVVLDTVVAWTPNHMLDPLVLVNVNMGSLLR